MNVCVFGSASSLIEEKYIRAGEELGRILALRGHDLIFGGGNEGMMGAAARGFRSADGHITGVIPEFFKGKEYEKLYMECDRIIYTEDISERLRQMQKISDAFLVLPGGVGTYEEFFDILVSRSLDRHDKPLVILNVDGYFDPLVSMLEHGVEQNFISVNCINNFCSFSENQLSEIADFLETII